MKKYLILSIFLAIVIAGGLYVLFTKNAEAPIVREEKPTYVHASENDIVVASPKPHEILGSIIDVRGRARGWWYFEASFPIVIENKDGVVIGQGVGTADGEWMTEEFVPFNATLTLTTVYTGSATLIFKKDNPSGEASRDASVRIPIVIQ